MDWLEDLNNVYVLHYEHNILKVNPCSNYM